MCCFHHREAKAAEETVKGGRGKNFSNNSGRGGYNNSGSHLDGNLGSSSGFNSHFTSPPNQSYNR
jgi:hypothetical protein